MSNLPPCPACGAEFTYEDNGIYICPVCANEWTLDATAEDKSDVRIVKDANGNVLEDGDTVTVIKDLKVRGAGGGVIKVGTKVSGIRLISDGVGDHDIDAKVPGLGQMQLKSSVVKKVV